MRRLGCLSISVVKKQHFKVKGHTSSAMKWFCVTLAYHSCQDVRHGNRAFGAKKLDYRAP